MGNRKYPYYAGCEKYRGPAKKCCCCAELARFEVTVQTSWFRGDDGVYLACEEHSGLARFDYERFGDLVAEREAHQRETVEAQHEETGRMWKGERRALPPRYQELPVGKPAESTK